MARIIEREKRRNSLVVVVGPTASGKSELAVRLAKRFGGEIISADSRQVYRGLDIGTAKVSKREMMGVPHHLLSVTSPKKTFTVVDYQNKAKRVLGGVFSRSRVPFIVGGSPLYIYALIEGWIFPGIKPNLAFRRRLEKLSTEELFSRLQKLDPARAKTIEPKNRRRLIRALEIVLTTGKAVPPLKKRPLLRLRPTCAEATAGKQGFGGQAYQILFLGMRRKKQELRKRIAQRIKQMFRRGLVAEVETLHKQGIPWKKFNQFGFEYKYVAQYLQGQISKDEMTQKIHKETLDFSRRQMLWFKKDGRIRWVIGFKQGAKIVKKFLRGEKSD